ncbi:HlyD family efflux transporter periplasmic adaptor subunit [Cognatiyoonia sp. IB215446]|uniref:HlyD family efflux transporter periplasmic adaptor subunit n=1 Tax=Cognatiyoonia sp. IB215446 TaxID=3097355 RepID=UPI002A0BE780|nr:HlyD family efflux transporter periplasmic adaptor subunit [Cognatiyoonia sp. IB215446]MDX8348943.1 HlyD family efflux transporter periplasmic adaptor subunit [Cognatiyoonia sp. IB215446]
MTNSLESTDAQVVDLPLEDAGTRQKKPTHETASAPDRPVSPSPVVGGSVIGVFRRIVPLLLAFLIGAIVGLYFQPPGLQAFFRLTGLEPGGGTDTPIAQAIDTVREQSEVSVVSEGDVVALGRIIPRDDIVTLALPFGAGDARIQELRARPGDTVSQGEVVAVLDNLSTLESAVASARVSLEVQNAALNQARVSIAASREEARAELERAEATAREAQSALTRTRGLFDRGVTTSSVLEEADTRAAQTARDVERARVTLSRFAGDIEDQVDVALARANVRAAEAEVTRAERDVDRASVRAPIAGTVLDVNVSIGERPGSDGILDLGNTDVMTVEAEVYQTLIGRVAIGDPVTVFADAFEQELTGTVTAIGLEIGRQSITSDDPAANTDARVVDVLVTLDDESTAAARRYTNLEVLVRIDAGRQE